MRKIFALVVVVLLPVAPVAASESLDTLFPSRAPIIADSPGMCRLELPAKVLGACRADLADLRIISDDGREIPFVVDSPDSEGTTTAVRYRAVPTVVDALRSREEIAGTVVYRESFVLRLPELPADVPGWDLVLNVSEKEFVCRLDVSAVEADGGRTPLLSSGSIFRLPAADAERLRVPIPSQATSLLQVALEGQNSGFLEPRFTVEASRFLSTAAASRAPLDIVETRNLGETTEVVVERPRGIVPRSLAIGTSTDAFRRSVTVWDEGPGADPGPLGSGTVLRVPAVVAVESLELPLRPPRGDRLRLLIDNLDSPALEEISVSAVIPRPALVFPLSAAPASAMLYFGGGRAHRPRYDLGVIDPDRRSVVGEEVWQILATGDPAQAQAVTLGPIEPNPSYDPAPVLSFAIHAGSVVDDALYSHRRLLEVVPSAEGLARLRLTPVDLAVARADLADLRIVDTEGRQWAYLRQDASYAVPVPLAVIGPDTGDRASRYRLEVPVSVLSVDRLDLEADAPFFDRTFTLMGRLEGGAEQVLARGRLVRRVGDPRPSTIRLGGERVTRLDLEVRDGDDAPLIFRRALAMSAAPDVFLPAEAGRYDLLLGFPDAEPPVYELERIRPTILAVPASEVVAGDLEPNPDFDQARRVYGRETLGKIALWGVLVLAVVVLMVLTLRAARQE